MSLANITSNFTLNGSTYCPSTEFTSQAQLGEAPHQVVWTECNTQNSDQFSPILNISDDDPEYDAMASDTDPGIDDTSPTSQTPTSDQTQNTAECPPPISNKIYINYGGGYTTGQSGGQRGGGGSSSYLGTTGQWLASLASSALIASGIQGYSRLPTLQTLAQSVCDVSFKKVTGMKDAVTEQTSSWVSGQLNSFRSEATQAIISSAKGYILNLPATIWELITSAAGTMKDKTISVYQSTSKSFSTWMGWPVEPDTTTGTKENTMEIDVEGNKGVNEEVSRPSEVHTVDQIVQHTLMTGGLPSSKETYVFS